MRRTHVRSTALRSVQYVPLAAGLEIPGADGFLILEMVVGGRYAYAVPWWACGLLMASRSIGRGFHALVRGRFPALKLEG